MLAFGINVSQFRAQLLLLSSPAAAAHSGRGRLEDLLECDLKIKQRVFFSSSFSFSFYSE